MEYGGSATAQIFGTTGGRTGTKAHQHHVWQIRRLASGRSHFVNAATTPREFLHSVCVLNFIES